MVLTEKRGKETLFKLSRKERIWVCSECNKQYVTIPAQCACSAPDKVFTEKYLPIPETKRSDYKVLENFIYFGDQLNKGSIVSLINKDYVTKGLVKRNLLSELEDAPKKIEGNN